MIPFLVKLANLLDDRGQHTMAREVDDLIEKLAQYLGRDGNSSYTQDWLDAHKKLNGLLRRLKEVITDPGALKKIDDYQGSISSLLSRKPSAELVDWSEAAWEEFKGVLRDVYNQIPERTGLREEFRDLDLKINQPAAIKAELPAPAPQAAQPVETATPAEQVSPGEASKAPAKPAPAKHKRVPSAQTQQLVSQIQKNLGMEQTGQWDKATNKKFIEVMNSQPEYAKMMAGGKFKGTLQQAVQYTSQLQSLNEMGTSQPQEDKASKAPAAPQAPASNLKSKYDLLDLQDEISQLRAKAKWGDKEIQALIGLATDAADNTRGDAAQKSEAFERYFKNRTKQYV